MKTYLTKIKYNKQYPPAVFMAKAFTGKEILIIASEICKKFQNVYYDELKTTFVCRGYSDKNKIMRYLADKYFYKH